METLISPSLLSADFLNLKDEIEMINRSEADWLHLDVMHLMIVHPENYIRQVAATGAMIMNVHYEACTHLHRTVQEIHAAGMKAAVTLNPATPVCVLEDIINDVEMVLLMSVNPGFGGQKFIANTLNKVERLRALIDRSQSKTLIEVDGGVQAETAPMLVRAGADVLVSGSYIFKAADPIATISSLKHTLQHG